VNPRPTDGEDDGDGSQSGGPPTGDSTVTEIDNADPRLSVLGVYEDEDYEAGDYGLLFYADTDAEELADDVADLRSNFEHYDRHVLTSLRAGGPAPAGAGPAMWRNPANALTLLRVALVPVIAALLLIGTDATRWWALAIFVFAAVTDSVDGWVARRRLGPTRWGKLADPLADKVLIIGSLAVLAYTGPFPWWAVAVIVVREVGVTLQRWWLVRRGVVMSAGRLGKAKTVSQIAAVIAYVPPGVPDGARLALLWLAVAVTVASGLDYAVRGGKRAVDAG
jgi:CDP-diacylglycerol--glycerol-3-phosphate 3-phosphatidyltransferase